VRLGLVSGATKLKALTVSSVVADTRSVASVSLPGRVDRPGQRGRGGGCPFRGFLFVVLANENELGGHTVRYILMICSDENAVSALGPEEGAAMLAEYDRFGQEMGSRGILKSGERLRPATSATTVQVRDGKVLTGDGPFAETKEQIGGIFTVECKDLDEAIEVASQIPAARHGTIEVRPVWER
jgi:hypothetical protein